MDYLTQKLLVNKGKELLQNVIDKNPEVQGVLNALFGAPAKGEAQSGVPQPQEGGTAQSGQDNQSEPVSADEAVDAIFNMFKKK